MHYSNLLLSTFLSLPLAYAQQQAADGLIVPFTSQLPLCASKCGPLYDVQGKCTFPNIASTDPSCFCSDSRLKPFNDGASSVSSICVGADCTPADSEKVRTWYTGYCSNQPKPSTNTAGGAGPTTTGKSSAKPSSGTAAQTWFEGHWKWVVMIVVVTVGIILLWVGAWLLRRRYLRKKDKMIEMKPPVGWGPNQAQAAASPYGDGIVDTHRGPPGIMGGHQKEYSGAVATPADSTRPHKGGKKWLRKHKENQ